MIDAIMNERIFTSKIIKSLNLLPDTNAYKIPDSGNAKRFSPIKPFDIVVDYKDKFIAIECKYLKGWKSLNINSFIQINKQKEIVNNQLENLMKHKYSFVFINVWEKNTFDYCIILDKKDINFLLGITSIKAKELKEYYKIECYRQIYNLNNIRNYIDD